MSSKINKTIDIAIKSINHNFKHVLEFGVYKGHTIRQIRNNLNNTFNVFGFDSFEGLPEDWVGTNCIKGSFNVDGEIPNVDGVTFFKGWFNETLPHYIQIAKPIALLHVDCDLYSSTKTVLYGLKDYILPGTILVFDEWYYNHLDIEANRQHEQKLFYEWVKDFNIKYELYPEIEEERKIVKIL